jgi:uncharacterized membrane protein YbaN (DUF454 family)
MHEPPHVSSPVLRAVLVVLGTIAVGLGVVGAFLPVLPTTPFLLLAAACYARASRRFYVWLLSNRVFGPTIRTWRERRAIPRRPRRYAVVVIVVTFSISIGVVGLLWARLAMAALGVGLLAWLLSVPVADDAPPPSE